MKGFAHRLEISLARIGEHKTPVDPPEKGYAQPFLEGLDLIRYMRSERRLMRIPIMMITAEQDIKLMANSFSAGATAFLPKPFTPDQLQRAIRMLIGNRKWTNKAA